MMGMQSPDVIIALTEQEVQTESKEVSNSLT
jgi:hypothetical protein